MSDNIIDIVHRLTYEVNDSSIKKQITTFNDLNKKVDNYQSALSDSANKDAATQKALQTELKKTLTARERVGNSIVAQVASNKKLQDSIKGEINLLEQLQNKLKVLEAQKAKASPLGGKSGIIDSRINELRTQIAGLSSASGGSVSGGLFGKGGVLGDLLGSGSSGGFGRQIFQGALFGLGIGGGFGLVTRLTSGLIELGKTYFDVTQRSLDLIKNTETLKSSFSGLGDELITLDNVFKNSTLYGDQNPLTDRLYAQSTDGLKRRAEAVKALGVEKDKQLAADQRQLTADQKVRESEKQSIESNVNNYKKVIDILKTQTEGDIRPSLKSVLKLNNIPKSISTQLLAAEKEAISNKVNVSSALLQVQRDYEAKYVNERQKSLDKQQEIEDANTAFTVKQVQAQYKLQVSLLHDLRKEQEEYNIAVLKDVFDTSKIRKDGELKELEITKQREKDEHGLSLGNLEAYEKKRQSIERKYALEREEFLLKQEDFFKELNKSILQSSIQTSQDILKSDVAPSANDFIEIAKQTNELLGLEQNKFADKLRSDANGNRELEIKAEEEISHRKEAILLQQNNNIIDAYKQFYSRLSQLIKEREGSILIEQGLSTSERADALSSRYAKFRISEASYRNLQQQETLRAAIQTDKTKFGSTTQQLTAAIATQQNIANNPNSTGKQIQDAKNEIELLQTELNNLDKDINEKSRNLHQLRVEGIFIEIDAYKQLVDSAVAAYQQINAAHAQYLDTEISIQTERVRESEVLAQRGNTAILQREEETLRKQEQQKELYAKREMELNAALALSNAIVAVAKAAAEGGVFAPATIAAVLAALVAGYGFVKSTQTSFTEPGFAEGGFTGHGGKHEKAGAVHRGEFVVNAEKTKQFRPLLEAIHRNDFGAIPMVNNDRLRINDNSLSKSDIGILAKKLDENTDAVRESKTSVNARVDQHGLAIFTQQAIKRDRRKWA